MNYLQGFSIVVLILFCYPSVSSGAEWEVELVRNHKYALVHDQKYLVLYFGEKNNLAVAYGDKGGPYTMPLYEWEVGKNGVLVFYEIRGQQRIEAMRLELIEVQESRVSVLKEGEYCVFEREMRR